jgi:hypothetical protein
VSHRLGSDASWSPTDLAERLDRYAADRLAPDPPELDRGRAAVLAAFAQRPAPSTAPGGRRGLHSWSLAAALGLLVIGASVAVAESGPGQPFYGLRLAIGSVTLPGEEPAHERGLASRLDDRLTEVRAAARNGDGPGAQAAINEYLNTLSELTRNGISDPDILDLLQRHEHTLQELLTVAPAQATGGVQQALDAAGHASGVVQPAESTAAHPTPPQNPGDSPPGTGKP